MFSKHVLLATVLAFSGCSLKLNDPVTEKISNIDTGSGCLAKGGDVLESFSAGTLTEAEHDAFYACLNKALTTFADNADGADKQSFAPAELGNFLSKYFLDGKTIRPELMAEAAALKQALFGGAPDRITRDELRHIIALFGTVQQSTRLLLPIMPLDADSYIARGYSADQFEHALSRFIKASSVLGEALRADQKSYHFDHFTNLVKELQLFLIGSQAPPAGHWTITLLRVSEVIRPAKSIFISPPRNEITVADWPKIFRLAPRYYATYLRAQFYKTSLFTSLTGNGLKRMEKFYNEFESILDFVLEQHPNQTISSAEIDDLIDTLGAQKMLAGCQPETVRAFVKALFGKLLGSSMNTKEFSITRENLSYFKETMRFALEGLHAIEALYARSGGDPLTREQISAVPSADLLDSTVLKNNLSIEAVESVKRTPFEVRTIFAGAGTSVVIPKVDQPNSFSAVHMVKIHGLRALNRLLLKTYGDGRKGELTESQLDTFMNDIFPIMKEFSLIDPDTRESVKDRLDDASLFLYSSDGFKSLNMAEALEIESLVLSTITRAPVVHAQIAAACGIQKPVKDEKTHVTPEWNIPADCYRREFLAQVSSIWDYIPGMAEFVSQSPARGQEEIFDRMAKFLRKGKAVTDDYTVSDSRCFILLPYYVELLFSRFDANHDGFFDNSEAEAAYHVFQPFLAAAAGELGYKNPKDHKAIYNYLLANRVLPTEEKFSYAIRRYLLGPEKFRVNRGQVVEIFEKLKSLSH